MRKYHYFCSYCIITILNCKLIAFLLVSLKYFLIFRAQYWTLTIRKTRFVLERRTVLLTTKRQCKWTPSEIRKSARAEKSRFERRWSRHHLRAEDFNIHELLRARARARVSLAVGKRTPFISRAPLFRLTIG